MDKAHAILVVDDDPDVALAARYALSGLAGRIDSALSLDGLEQTLAAGEHAAVLLDMNFVAGESGGRAGLDGLARIRAADPTLAVVLMTAYGGVQLAVEALKRGAADFVLKPWKNDRLVEAMTAAVSLTETRRNARSATLDDLEREAIRQALADHDGNISKAAAALGVTRPALYRKIEKHGL
jgi:DNA-binding NtrC family response regulator